MITISTKKGDGGQSKIIGTELIDKDSQIFQVLGDLDELNSWIGVVVAHLKLKTTKSHQKLVEHLLDVQEKLFTLSAEIAGSKKVKLVASDLTNLEKRANQIQKSLSKNWHTKFIFPGGSRLAAWADVARSVGRRCERQIVALSKTTALSPLVLKYLNRLSDYLYLVRCQLNDLEDVEETKFNDV